MNAVEEREDLSTWKDPEGVMKPAIAQPAEIYLTVPLRKIALGQNTRTKIDSGSVMSLARSIAEVGVIQPLILRPAPDGSAVAYELVCGERRLRAAQIAGVETVPAIVRSLGDREAVIQNIAENVDRESMNPVDVARGWKRLADEYGMTQAAIAEEFRVSAPAVSSAFRMLRLPEEVLGKIERGELSISHGEELCRLIEHPEIARRLAEMAYARQWTVRVLSAEITDEERVERERVKAAAAAPAMNATTPAGSDEGILSPAIEAAEKAFNEEREDPLAEPGADSQATHAEEISVIGDAPLAERRSVETMAAAASPMPASRPLFEGTPASPAAPAPNREDRPAADSGEAGATERSSLPIPAPTDDKFRPGEAPLPVGTAAPSKPAPAAKPTPEPAPITTWMQCVIPEALYDWLLDERLTVQGGIEMLRLVCDACARKGIRVSQMLESLESETTDTEGEEADHGGD